MPKQKPHPTPWKVRLLETYDRKKEYVAVDAEDFTVGGLLTVYKNRWGCDREALAILRRIVRAVNAQEKKS